MNQLTDVWKRVRVGKPDECWKWTGYTNADGYGTMSIRKKMKLAHRVVHEVSNGPIPDGFLVRHSCDNPCCCNPAHLSLGTDADNMKDKQIRGRAWRKVDADTVREIRRSTETTTSLGKRFGISRQTAWQIRRGFIHRHLL